MPVAVTVPVAVAPPVPMAISGAVRVTVGCPAMVIAATIAVAVTGISAVRGSVAARPQQQGCQAEDQDGLSRRTSFFNARGQVPPPLRLGFRPGRAAGQASPRHHAA